MRPQILVACLALLAGCVQPPPPEDSEGPLAGAPTRLAYGDCEELLGAFPVEPDAIALPEGFSPAPFLVESRAAIFVVGWSCASAHDDVGGNATGDFVEAFAGFGVTPPEEHALENAFAHAILLGLGTSSPLGLATYEAWNVPAAGGAIEFAWQSTPAGGSGTLAGPAGPLDVAMRVNAGGPPAGEAASAVRFFVVEDGNVTAAYDIAWTDAGGHQGQAVSSAPLPGAPPATTGLGFHYASDLPERYVMTPYALTNATG